MSATRALRRALGALATVALLACASGSAQRSTGEYVDDSVVTAKVKSALVADPTTKAYQIDVDTYDGVVQLNGFVDNNASISRATQVARDVAGVKQVQNNLKLREE